MNKKQSMAMAVLLISGVLITAVVAQHFARMSNVEQTSVQVTPSPPLLYTIDAVVSQIEAGVYSANFLNCTIYSQYETTYVTPWILISCADGITTEDISLFCWFSYAGEIATEGELLLIQINATAVESSVVRSHDDSMLLTGESLVLRYSIDIHLLQLDSFFDIYLWAEDNGV